MFRWLDAGDTVIDIEKDALTDVIIADIDEDAAVDGIPIHVVVEEPCLTIGKELRNVMRVKHKWLLLQEHKKIYYFLWD